MDVVLPGMKTTLILLYILPSELLDDHIHCQRAIIFCKESSEQQLSTVDLLHIVSKPSCKQMWCHPGFVALFIEHRQSRFRAIRKSFLTARYEINYSGTYVTLFCPDRLT